MGMFAIIYRNTLLPTVSQLRVSFVILISNQRLMRLEQLRGVAAGLVYLHGRKIVHGDVKPVSTSPAVVQ